MKSWVRHMGFFCAAGLAVLWSLPAPAGQMVRTIHPMPGHQKAQPPDAGVQPPPGQIHWNSDGSDRFQYMQAYRETMSACVTQVFPPVNPRAGLSALPDDEMTSDKQILVNKCMAGKGMSAGPAMFMPPNVGIAKFGKAANNMTVKYMQTTEAKAIQNMTKRFDKIFAARKKAYMARLAAAHPVRGYAGHQPVSPVSMTAPVSGSAEDEEAPPIYVAPSMSGQGAHTESQPEGQLWVTPRSQ